MCVGILPGDGADLLGHVGVPGHLGLDALHHAGEVGDLGTGKGNAVLVSLEIELYLLSILATGQVGNNFGGDNARHD